MSIAVDDAIEVGRRPVPAPSAVRSPAVQPLGKKTKILYRVVLALWVLLFATTAPVLLPVIPVGLVLFRLLMWDHRDVPEDFRRDWRAVRRCSSRVLHWMGR